LITVSKPALLCDTGLLSRVFLAQAPFLEAYKTAVEHFQETISTPSLLNYNIGSLSSVA
jgi:hypothetical protein